MKLLIVTIVAGLFFSSCSQKDIPATALSEENPAAASNSNQPQTNTAGSTVALNPEHGKPGHRCDIPVGAPLNSAPAKVTAPKKPNSNSFNTNPLGNIQTSQTSVQVQAPAAVKPTTPAPAKIAPGTNPPHGQPGHKCEIPVGAPLK